MGWDLYPAFVNAGKVMVLGNYVIRIGSYRTIDKFIVVRITCDDVELERGVD